ncbi:MAG: hypothetical protein KDC95_14590 [Planctomycetes bacterium]|nr:hypothetical protein [Planctomycetota bacterium]
MTPEERNVPTPENQNPASRGRGSSIALWGGAIALAGALVYGGFIYPQTVRPDAGTLLSMCQLHLGLAQQIPVTDAKTHEQRKINLDKALEILTEVEADRPGLSITAEFRGFALWLRGDFDAAKREYATALERVQDDADLRIRLQSNLAAIELESGSPDRAIECIAAIEGDVRTSSVWITEAQAWQAKGDSGKRSASLESGLRSAVEKGDEGAIFSIAEAAASLGDDIATSAFTKLGVDNARAQYRLAQLKIRENGTDSATSMLEAIAKKAPEALKRWVHEDRGFWVGDRKALADRVLSVAAGPSR